MPNRVSLLCSEGGAKEKGKSREVPRINIAFLHDGRADGGGEDGALSHDSTGA